ncbi:restriction endonuclease subunit S [Gordonia sputi]
MTTTDAANAPWLPAALPEGWTVTQMRRLARFRNGADYKPVEVVEGGYPVYGSGGEFKRASEFLFDGESVLFGRKGTIDKPLLVSGRFWTVDTMFFTEPYSTIEPRFLHYYATTIPFAYYSTSTALPSMTQGELGSHRMPLPPLDEQRAIADFLDRETARIDTLIAEQQRLIELLRERKDAEWSSQLLKTQQYAPVAPLRRLLSSISDGPFGSSLTSAHYSDSGARVIRLGNIGINEFKNGDEAYISLEYAAELSAHSVIAGDVVIAGLGDDKMPLGRAAVVPCLGPALVKADCYRARPVESVSSEYLAWALSAPPTREQMMLLARGATRARLNTSVVQHVMIPLPSRDVQDQLVDDWNRSSLQFDRLISESEKFVELSRERRSALITAAVTGQIDIREKAAG